MRSVLLLIFVLLAGCAAVPDPNKVDPNHDAYLKEFAAIRDAEREREKDRREAYAAMAEACAGDPDCVREVAREATLGEAFAAAGGGRQQATPQPYVRPKTGGERVAEILAHNLSAGLVPTLVQGAVSVVQSDNGAAVAISGNEMIRGIATSAIGVADRGLQVLPGLAPSYTSGGPMVLGNQQTGNNFDAGRDLWGDGNRVGDEAGDINTGTQVDRGIVGSGNRLNSPDDNSETCIGPGCQGENAPIINPPPPEDDEEEGEGKD